MSRTMDNVKTLNSLVRTMVLVVFLGAAGYGGYLGYANYIRPGIYAQQAIAELDQLKVDYHNQEAELRRLIEENDRIKTSLRLLKVDRRLANIEVLETSTNEAGEPTMLVRFTELDEFGTPIGASRDFQLRGDKMYVDCWVVKFGDKYVEQADALRSASLCVFKGIYGNLDGPEGAKSLDSASEEAYPDVYADARKSAFESQIWSDFWQLANDEESQEELGIRAIHGQANYLKVQPKRTYEVNVRASGSASLEPVARN